ncbi:MAG: hypothetical protein V1723_04620 [Candidatus Uhrbacteria bacterium]
MPRKSSFIGSLIEVVFGANGAESHQVPDESRTTPTAIGGVVRDESEQNLPPGDPPQSTCWFCRKAITDERTLVFPGGQTLWPICAACAREAIVDLILNGSFTVEDVAAACNDAIRVRSTAAAAKAETVIAPLRTVAQQIAERK